MKFHLRIVLLAPGCKPAVPYQRFLASITNLTNFTSDDPDGPVAVLSHLVYLVPAARDLDVSALCGSQPVRCVGCTLGRHVAILFHLGLFLYVIVRSSKDFPAGRAALVAASCVSGLISTAILWILMHKIFPHATYGTTPVFQLFANLSPNQLVPFLMFFTPILYTYLRIRSSGTNTSGPEDALRLSAVFYLASWVLVGLVQEVRIFVPFAFALMPQTVNTLANSLERDSGVAKLVAYPEDSQVTAISER